MSTERDKSRKMIYDLIKALIAACQFGGGGMKGTAEWTGCPFKSERINHGIERVKKRGSECKKERL